MPKRDDYQATYKDLKEVIPFTGNIRGGLRFYMGIVYPHGIPETNSFQDSFVHNLERLTSNQNKGNNT